MKSFIKLSIVFVLILSGVSKVMAQKEPRFGKLDMKNLKATVCPIDSNAHAYYIFDYGEARFEYGDTHYREDEIASEHRGFELHYNRHFRIKILDNDGFSYAEVKIPLYHAQKKEEITKLKACTYNLVKGKIEKTKLSQSDVMTEETSKHWNTVKFALPNVKAGSIVEVDYTVKSVYFFNIPTWYFQRNIPVLHSEFLASVPEYYYYNQSSSGYYPVKFDHHTTQQKLTMTYTYTSDTGQPTGRETDTESLDYKDNVYHYVVDNVPAFPNEKFLRNKDDYMSKVDFELQYTKFPQEPLKYFTTTWEDVDKEFHDCQGFGNELQSAGYIRDAAKELRASGAAGLQLLNLAYTYIKKHIAWNGNQNSYASHPLARTFRDGSGNCADVNLNLVRLLKELGFQSYPVVLSTQKNGLIPLTHPSLSSFNYVVAAVLKDSKAYLLDATDHDAEINLLPIRCLNGKGRIIGNVPQKWINLMNYQPFVLTATSFMKMDSTASFRGSMNLQMKGYGAYELRKLIRKYNDPKKFVNKLDDDNANKKVEDIKIKGLDSLYRNLDISYKFINNDKPNASTSMIYFSPVVNPYFSKNPFKLENRQYPVEFNHPYIIRQVQAYMIPADYHIEEVPKTINIKLPDNSAQFIYQVQVYGNSMTVSTAIQINKSIFLPSEYPSLKKFFQMMIDKEHELVVLKHI